MLVGKCCHCRINNIYFSLYSKSIYNMVFYLLIVPLIQKPVAATFDPQLPLLPPWISLQNSWLCHIYLFPGSIYLFHGITRCFLMMISTLVVSFPTCKKIFLVHRNKSWQQNYFFKEFDSHLKGIKKIKACFLWKKKVSTTFFHVLGVSVQFFCYIMARTS